MAPRRDLLLLRVLCRGDRTPRHGKRAGDHFQHQCCSGRPARIVLGISYARRPEAVLWWERLLSTSLSSWVRRILVLMLPIARAGIGRVRVSGPMSKPLRKMN